MRKGGAPYGAPPLVWRKRIEPSKKRRFSCMVRSSRQSFAVRRRRNKMQCPKFRGHAPRNFAFSACKRASEASALQQAASPRENACIFEKRVELVRHAEGRCAIWRTALFFMLPVGSSRTAARTESAPADGPAGPGPDPAFRSRTAAPPPVRRQCIEAIPPGRSS